MADVAGFIHADLNDDGTMQVKIEGAVSYPTIYGVAAVLHEIARQQQAQAALQQMAEQGGRIIVPRPDQMPRQ